jgi:hypothetical protein
MRCILARFVPSFSISFALCLVVSCSGPAKSARRDARPAATTQLLGARTNQAMSAAGAAVGGQVGAGQQTREIASRLFARIPVAERLPVAPEETAEFANDYPERRVGRF